MTDAIKVTFIIPKEYESENECSEEMLLAFTACEQHCGGGLEAQWIKETSWKFFTGLTKRDVFVLSEFAGEIYERLRTTKCLIVGPRCLSCCLTEGIPIPSGPDPVYTIAMRGLVVTASGLTKQKKEYIKKKVQWMGGLYSTVLTDDTTHLVSDTVLSDKYIKSVEKGIPVMSESWIDAVWEASLQLNINGSSSDFNSHKLPAFANLQVTTSGISKKDKQMIMKLVNEHGGMFSGAFQSETTDIVVLTKEGIGGEKYKAALEYGKACVLPTWVKDSAAKGVALPLVQYRVAGASTSSPFAEHRLPDMSLNFSRIPNSRLPSNFVDETRATDVSTISGRMKLSQDSSKKSNDSSSVDKDVIAAFENFDMSNIKKAGPIFDGFCRAYGDLRVQYNNAFRVLMGLPRYCSASAMFAEACTDGFPAIMRKRCASLLRRVRDSPNTILRALADRWDSPMLIWVTGLEGVCRERAAALVSRCGGVRYDCPHARVTHAVAGSRASAAGALRALPAVAVLSPQWLLHSVRQGKPLPESDYLIDLKPATPAKSARKAQLEPSSPMSKRNLQLLRRGALDLPPPTPDVPEPVEDEIVNHYLSQQMPEPEPMKEITPEPAAAGVTVHADVTSDVTEQPTEEIEQIFTGIKIEVQGLDEEAICELGAEVGAAGGVLSAAGAGGSHALVPLDFDPEELVTKDAEPVTVFWVKDCLSQQELLPIQYYHRPVRVPASAGAGPLEGVVASLSTYSGVERAFLDELAKLLGATTQLRFCRRNTANALASTHLICPTPTGDKYMGALKWGLPAVQASWLLACAKTGKRESEREHLVGDTKAPPSPEKPEVQISEPSKGQKEENTALDKENEMRPPASAAVPRRGSPGGDGTPKAKNMDAEDMSPASRYIAMARQGLLGGDSQETPKRVQDLKGDAKQEGEVRTPPLDDALSTPNLRGLSPTTRRRIQAVRRGEMPSDPIRTPTDPFEKNPETPDSAFGAALRPGSGRLSPDARKRLWRLVQDLPSKEPQPAKQKHTPLSEIRNRFLAQFNGDAPTPPSQHHVEPRKLLLQEQADTPPAKMQKISADQSAGSVSSHEGEDSTKSASSTLPAAVDAQLDRLSAALSNRNLTPQRRRNTASRDSLPVPAPAPETEPGPESQPNTVGWDDAAPPARTQDAPAQTQLRRFMLSSNVDNREEIIEMIIYLGGEVCEGSELDPEATHLLCAAPGRSEKMLGSIAAGRWVLHPAYVARSRTSGTFLDEEEFEWGNPLATCLPSLSGAERALAAAAWRWRSARARGAAGPLAGVAALLHVPAARRRLLARLVRAGGGTAPPHQPPYNDDNITVCFADVKRYPVSERDKAWLISKKIPVCAPVLISQYLTDDLPPNPEEHCLPEFRPR